MQDMTAAKAGRDGILRVWIRVMREQPVLPDPTPRPLDIRILDGPRAEAARTRPPGTVGGPRCQPSLA